MTIIAHRGASAREPENTLRAFRRAAVRGCRWIECDVRITEDNVPVILHDATVVRTTNGRGPVSRIPYRELRKLDAGKGERIPSLEETLPLIKTYQIGIVLEIKDPRALQPTIEILKSIDFLPQKKAVAGGISNRVIISSFTSTVLLRAKQLFPRLATALIIANPRTHWVRAAQKSRADMVHSWAPLATKKMVADAHAAGLKVWAWTVNTRKQVKELLSQGVDGVFTNYPERFL